MTNENRVNPSVKPALSRRSFIQSLGTGAVTTTTLTQAFTYLTSADANAADTPELIGPQATPIQLLINGKEFTVEVEPRETLLEVLRNRLDFTGAKPICEQGTCGGCTVLLDGKTAYSCMMLAIEAQGHEILTIEGLAQDNILHPVQQAFLEEDAYQCGFCTPGFIMSSAYLLQENPLASQTEIRAGLAGHICRCGAYAQIFKAVGKVQQNMGGRNHE